MKNELLDGHSKTGVAEVMNFRENLSQLKMKGLVIFWWKMFVFI